MAETTQESLMLRHRLYHEVLGPFIRLRARAAENVCVQSENNDVIALAQEAATAAYHFPEAIHGASAPMTESSAEDLRQKLGDVADTRKHGVLRDPERQVRLSAALAYEVNEEQLFKYLGTQVWAENKRFGSFDLVDVIQRFIVAIGREFSLGMDIEIKLPSYDFSKQIVTYVTDKTFRAANVRLRFFSRDANGQLRPVDPTEVEFAVYDLKTGKSV